MQWIKTNAFFVKLDNIFCDKNNNFCLFSSIKNSLFYRNFAFSLQIPFSATYSAYIDTEGLILNIKTVPKRVWIDLRLAKLG